MIHRTRQTGRPTRLRFCASSLLRIIVNQKSMNHINFVDRIVVLVVVMNILVVLCSKVCF